VLTARGWGTVMRTAYHPITRLATNLSRLTL
jgi:hypothetical protein